MPGAGDDGYEYELGLRNSLAGPAASAVTSLTEVESALVRTDRALHGVHGGAHTVASGISYAVRGFDDLARGGRYAANGVLDVGKAFQRLGPWLAGAAFVGGAAAISHFAFEASEAKEQAVDAFGVLTGGAEQGARTFRALDTLADSVHAPAEKVAGLAKELLELGLTKQNSLLQTVRAVEDLQRVGLSSGADRIKSVVERSLAAGHLVLGRGGAGAARALTGTGVSEADVAAQLGLSPKQLEASLKAGKISVEEGLSAIDHAIIQGKVGALATKKFTVSDAFTDLHNAMRRVFQESDTGPVTDALRRLTDGFADGTDGARQLSDVVDVAFRGVGTLIDAAHSIGDAFADAADASFDAWDKAVDAITRINPFLSDEQKTQAIAKRHVQRHAELLGDAMVKQQQDFEKVQDLAKSGASTAEIQKLAKRLGLDVSVLPPGHARPHTREPEGITREVPGLEVRPEEGTFSARIPPGSKKSLETMGGQAADSVEQGWREAAVQYSPSKVMMDLGSGAFDGLESGAQQGAKMFQESAPAGRSVTVHVDVGGLHVPVSVDADDFLPLLESQVADVFERVALELGG
jgi:hypothetical protein